MRYQKHTLIPRINTKSKWELGKCQIFVSLPFFPCPDATVGNYFIISGWVGLVKHRKHKECKSSYEKELHLWFLSYTLSLRVTGQDPEGEFL